MSLTRFWFRFRSIQPHDSLRLGCGVTAYTHDDALSILRKTVFKDSDVPPVDEVIENVDIRSLDQKHVVPNMDPPVWRGVWFPKGYTQWQTKGSAE
jgi:hypothetical protein